MQQNNGKTKIEETFQKYFTYMIRNSTKQISLKQFDFFKENPFSKKNYGCIYIKKSLSNEYLKINKSLI